MRAETEAPITFKVGDPPHRSSIARSPSNPHKLHQLPHGRGGFSGAAAGRGGANRLLCAGEALPALRPTAVLNVRVGSMVRDQIQLKLVLKEGLQAG